MNMEAVLVILLLSILHVRAVVPSSVPETITTSTTARLDFIHTHCHYRLTYPELVLLLISLLHIKRVLNKNNLNDG